MNNIKRDLLVVTKENTANDKAIEQEVDCLNKMLQTIENDQAFCLAHELATRFFITQNPNRILNASVQKELSSFQFLINKN